MAMDYYTISGTAWTVITISGQTGTCWLNDPITNGNCVIYHSSSIPDTSKKVYGKKVYKSTKNNDVCIIDSDNTTDIYYAMVDNESGSGTIIVDVV